ncbi:MAG: hypothetical protein Q9159_005466 [Coniocarpon cinnabarinum]
MSQTSGSYVDHPLAFLLPGSSASIIVTLLLVIPLMVTYTAQASRTYFPNLKNARILLLTAHPDDEVMFFAPTVLALTDREAGNHLKVLCLSRGNADRLGELRQRELTESCRRLGLREEDSMCLEDKQLQDGFHSWNSTYIRDMLLRFFTQDEGKAATIDAIVTFDAVGVSNHPNHRSCFEAAKAFADAMHGRVGGAGWEVPVAVYSLTSVNILRKYSGAVDVVASVAMSMFHIITRKDKDKPGWKSFQGQTPKAKERDNIDAKDAGKVVQTGKLSTHLLFVSGLGDWMKSLGAMTQGHKSQMVWFRWGWVSLGRYLWVNDLRRVR